MGLPAMVGLVIEEMCHQQAARLAQLLVGRLAEPDLLVREPVLAHARGPTRNSLIGLDPRPLELAEIGDQGGAVFLHHAGLLPTIEAPHPYPIAPEQMAQCAVDRAPERAARKASGSVRQSLRGGVDAAVH